MKNKRIETAWTIQSADVLESLLALYVLLPIAGALPGIASEGQPLVDSLWFGINLCGPLILLAGGLKGWFGKMRFGSFAVAFACVVALLGAFALQLGGFHRLIAGWILMTLYLAGLLVSLRRPWLWAIVGTTWSLFLLGTWSTVSTIGFITTETQQFSFFLPLQVLAFGLSLVVLFLHLRYRTSSDDDRS
jgi:hypothetical protein